MLKNKAYKVAFSIILAVGMLGAISTTACAALTNNIVVAEEAVQKIKRLSTPKNVLLKKSGNTATASWSNVQNNNGYEIFVVQNKKRIASLKLAQNKNSFDLSEYISAGNTGDNFHISVYARGKSGKYRNSVSAKSNTINFSSTKNIEITANGQSFIAEMADTAAAKELVTRLPTTMEMGELNGNEKYFYAPYSLPSSSQSVGTINAGDIMLYGSDCIVIFYKSFQTSYSYTKLGKIADSTGLEQALGSGGVSVSFAAAE